MTIDERCQCTEVLFVHLLELLGFSKDTLNEQRVYILDTIPSCV